ncbi:MAG: hypothetical protein ACK4R2_09595 [Roseateles sp.]
MPLRWLAVRWNGLCFALGLGLFAQAATTTDTARPCALLNEQQHTAVRAELAALPCSDAAGGALIDEWLFARDDATAMDRHMRRVLAQLVA